MTTRFAVVCVVGCACACLPTHYRPGCDPEAFFQDQTSYRVDYSRLTAEGVAIDGDVDPADVDAIVDEVEGCLRRQFPGGRLGPDVTLHAWCEHDHFASLDRECITVKVPERYTWSCDGTQQVLFDRAPDVSCEAKGLDPTSECPCRWRSAIQDQQVAVSTPDLYNVRDPIVRIVTRCMQPWSAPELAACMRPRDVTALAAPL